MSLVRSVRDGFDLAKEKGLEWALREYVPDLDIAYYLSNSKNDHLSSSLIRELQSLGLDVTKFVPSAKEVYNMV